MAAIQNRKTVTSPLKRRTDGWRDRAAPWRGDLLQQALLAALLAVTLTAWAAGVAPPLASAVANDDQSMNPREGEGDHLTRAPEIRNGVEPRDGHGILRPREVWRRGGEDDEVLFGFIITVEGDEDGRVYLLDRWLATVFVISAEGTLVDQLSREGEGPGETRQPTDLTRLPGGELGIVQPMPGRLVRIDRLGDPAGTLVPEIISARAAQFGILTEAEWRGGTLVGSGSRVRFNEEGQRQSFFLSVFDLETGAERARLLQHETLNDGRSASSENYWVNEGRWCLGPDGCVYVAPDRDAYAVHVFGTDGRLERIIARDYVPWRRSADEKSALAARYAPGPDEFGAGRKVHISDFEPCLSELYVADNGELWVRHGGSGRAEDPGIFQTWDVYSPAGHYVRSIGLELPGDPTRDRLFFLPRERLVVVRGFQEASRAMWGAGSEENGEESPPIEVICYEARSLAAR